MLLQHLDRGEQRRRRDFAGSRIARHRRLGLVCRFADQRCGLLPAECPAAFARLAAGARRDVPFAPADPAIAIPHFEDDRLEFGERAIGEHVRPDQGQTDLSQRELVQLYRLTHTPARLQATAHAP
jgi:hypothetical protein